MKPYSQQQLQVLQGIYRGALSASGSSAFAAGLASQAWYEKSDSNFNPTHVEDGGTSFGIFNTGGGVWNDWVSYAKQNGIDYKSLSSAQDYAAYITNYFSRVAPDAAAQAFSAQSASGALSAYRTWNYGGAQNRGGLADEFLKMFGDQPPPSGATPQPADIGHEFYIDPTDFEAFHAGSGQPQFDPSQFELPQLGAQPPNPTALANRPGFADLSNVVPQPQFPNPITNEAMQPTAFTNPETGFEINGGFPPPAYLDANYGTNSGIQFPTDPNDYGFTSVVPPGSFDTQNPVGSPGEVTDNAFADESWLPAGAPPEEYGQRVDDPFADPSWADVPNESSSGEVTDNPFEDQSWLPEETMAETATADSDQTPGGTGPMDPYQPGTYGQPKPFTLGDAHAAQVAMGQQLGYGDSLWGGGTASVVGPATSTPGAPIDTSVFSPTRGMTDMLGLMGAPAGMNRPGGGGSGGTESTFAENKLDMAAADAGFDSIPDYLTSTNPRQYVTGWERLTGSDLNALARSNPSGDLSFNGSNVYGADAAHWSPTGYTLDPALQVAMPTLPPALLYSQAITKG